MGTGVRVHFLDEEGQISRISTAKFNELTSTGVSEHFKAYAGQSVRCAVSFVQIENRKVKHISYTEYSIIHFDQNGNQDEAESARELELAMSGFNILEKVRKHREKGESGNVLNLNPKISERKYQNDFNWTPTQEQINAIIRDILPSK
ncbi:MAG: hypothetical protein OQJ89_01550 [Kangiellaceae bacterium]|nr:hypothetical protein [Kangiellaceae bacterium]MCW8999154.1 hypothetical protein [Kangiellaceae bacterium]MCW9015628.1 hypothetical protein [Kangiellaceae bacterium]